MQLRLLCQPIPKRSGIGDTHSQQPYDDQISQPFAVFALLGAPLLALPELAPEVKAYEMGALAKAERLATNSVAGNCAGQIWPNIASTCLRQTGSDIAVREARLVTAKREP